MHVVYKYYTNMSVNRRLVWKSVYLEPYNFDGIHIESSPGTVFSFSYSVGVTTDVLGRPSTCAECKH